MNRFPLTGHIVLTTILSLQPIFVIVADFTGLVVSVLDGDTVSSPEK
jgi:hypothetical protein